jgi:hypothetical protein
MALIRDNKKKTKPKVILQDSDSETDNTTTISEEDTFSDDDLILDNNLLDNHNNKKKIILKLENIKINNNDNNNNKDKIKKFRNNIPNDIKCELKFSEKLDNIISNISEQIMELKKTKLDISKIKKFYEADINIIWKQKNKKKKLTEVGFINKQQIPKKLSNILQIDENIKLSLPEITKLFINNVLRKRNLIYEQDKRVYRIDNDIHELLDISYDVNNSVNYLDKEGFNFNTLQRILNNYLKNNN